MASSVARVAAAVTQQKIKFMMGKCMPSHKSNAARIQIPTWEYDERLHMHFKKYDYVFAHDPKQICKTGDMVLIQNLPEQMTRLITHKVLEVIFPLGDVTDPITGKKVAAGVYREDIKEVNKLYGESKGAFDYDKAAPRGRLEGERDFTDKPVYKKWYEDEKDPQPYSV